MRLFIAVNVNDDTRSSLIRLQNDLRSNSKHGNFSSPENIHLTLVFIGECNEAQTKNVKEIMNSTSFEQFELIIDNIGRFRRNGGDIWWAGVRSNEHILTLQQDLTKKLTVAGFDIDTREYNPHITLGREVRTNEQPKNIEQFSETVNKIDLMMSDRIDGRLVYTRIYEKEAGK